MKSEHIAALWGLAAAVIFAAGGPSGALLAEDGFRDAPNGGSALAALEETALGGGAASGVPAAGLPVPGAPARLAVPGGEDGVSKQVLKFLAVNGEDFGSYEPSCRGLDSCGLADGYRLHEKIYFTRGEVSSVFRAFVGQAPKQAWNGSSKFEMMYDRATRRVYTRASADTPAIATGQIFFLTLYLPLGLKMPVVFETVVNDPRRHEFAFSYVKANKSNGIQFISFKQSGDMVEIKHTTHYKSASEFRDKHLYARFHEMLTDDFYGDFFKSLQKR